jgi:hypothetical protein
MPKFARGADGPKLRALNMKTTHALRERMEAAAVASGRSLSSEVEHRLIESFVASDLRTLIREEIRAALAERDEAQGFPAPKPEPSFVWRY